MFFFSCWFFMLLRKLICLRLVFDSYTIDSVIVNTESGFSLHCKYFFSVKWPKEYTRLYVIKNMLDLESIPCYNHSIMSKYRISGALKTLLYLSKSGPRPKNLFFVVNVKNLWSRNFCKKFKLSNLLKCYVYTVR